MPPKFAELTDFASVDYNDEADDDDAYNDSSC
jgi:hypothetical protein